MMLLLCSNGLTSPALRDAVRTYTKGMHTAALVVTADHVYKDNNYHVPRCKKNLVSLGLSVELFDLDDGDPETLLHYDVIEFIGGNPFYLLDSIRKNQARSVLERCARQRLLIGWSAAAFVFGPTLELANRYTPEMNFLNLSDLTGLELTRIPVLPHYSKFLQKINHFEEICAAYEEESQTTVLRLNDGDGILIDQEQTVLIGGQ